MGNSLGLCLSLKQKAKTLDLCYCSHLETCSSERHIPEDRLSSLPDEILLVILSFLTVKDGVKTSILSRQWLKLWLHTPVLIFRSPDPKARFKRHDKYLYYVAWVNHVLQRYKGQCLTEFEIVCDLNNFYQKDIDNWLIFAFSRQVQRLELNLLDHGDFPKCSKLNYVFPDHLLKFSSGKANSDGGRFDLKCLKHLSLKSVDVTCEVVNHFLLHCPFLERLEVVDTGKLVNLEISGPNLALKYLKIRSCHNLEVLGISNFNLVSLEIPSNGDLTLTDLPMLVEVSITKASGLSPSHSLCEASSFHSQLEALALWGIDLEDVTKLTNLDRLTRLKRLVIEVGAYGDESMTMLISIINYFPCLEEFTLVLCWIDPDRTNRSIFKVERNSSSPKSQSLKVFKFLGYFGRVSDVELIIHVVENAVCLEKIIIDPCDRPILEYKCSKMKKEVEKTRNMALKQVKALRKSESIPPHVRVAICEPYTLNSSSLWH